MSTALITGASSGLGLEFAKIYAKEGFDLIVVARSEGKLYKLKEELEEKYHHNVYVFVQDLSLSDAAYKIFNFTLENNIAVDILVNDAGFGDFGNFWEVGKEKQISLLNVNMVAVVQLTRYFLPSMVERKDGKILNISSVASFMAGPKMSLYYASKAFVKSFSEAIADELKGTGVTVTALLPGPTSTSFEQASEMKNSKMFTFLRPLKANKVAEKGHRAVKKGKVLCYCGAVTKLAAFGSRILPRATMKKIAKKVNGGQK